MIRARRSTKFKIRKTPAHVLKRLARHARVDTTMSFYTHILRGDDISAIESLQGPEKAVKKAKRKRAAS